MLRALFIFWLATSSLLYAATPDYCLPGDPAGFNPQVVNDEATRLATRPIYDHLVEFRSTRRPNGIHAGIEAGLAESWEISRNGRVYTFQLRRGVRFHQTAYFSPTRLFEADDVLFSFNRQRLSAHPFHPVSGGSYPEFAAGLQANLAQVEKVNDHSVRFHLNAPDPEFLGKLARDGAVILSAEYGETLLSKGTAWEIDQMPVGTGPYSLQKYERGKLIAYQPNLAYFHGRPTLASLRFPIVPPGARDEKIRSGHCTPTTGFIFP